jgi:hypothetical protein
VPGPTGPGPDDPVLPALKTSPACASIIDGIKNRSDNKTTEIDLGRTTAIDPIRRPCFMMRHITFDPRLTEGAEGNENVLIKFGG